ncbi:MAG: tetratricopeptide repeat protein [Flavobacteriales bacterium]|nr:tetratricopeptide repeat protein [Flavobacteriales bacterium]
MSIRVITSIIVFFSTYTYVAAQEQVAGDSVHISTRETVSFESYYYKALNEKIKGNHKDAVELLRLALRFKPENADAQFELSINYKSLKDYRTAALFGENAVRLSPDKKWYWLNIADLYSLLGDSKNAERCYGKLVEIDPTFVPEYIMSIARTGNITLALDKVNVFLKNGETEALLLLKRDLLVANERIPEAIGLTKKLITYNKLKADYYYEISELFLREKDVDSAEKYVKAGLLLLPENPILIRQDFKLLMIQSNYEEAFIVLDEAFDNPKLSFNDKLGFVIAFVDSDKEHKQTDRLISALENWVDEYHEVKVYPIIANLYGIKGNKEKSLEYFREGFDKGYNEFSSLIEMLLLEQELGKYDLLFADSNRMLVLFPSHPVLYLFKGFSENQLKDYACSIETLHEGLEFVVNNDKLKSEFYSISADSYYQLGNEEDAFREYDKALLFDPENIGILNNYSYFLAESGVELDKALEMIKIVVDKNSENATYLDTMAWVHYKKGDYEEARKILKRAIKAGGDKSADILEHYGDILFKLDKVNLAVRQWEKAYKFANSSEVLKEKINNRSLGDEN